jgi:hypothetical protein
MEILREHDARFDGVFALPSKRSSTCLSTGNVRSSLNYYNSFDYQRIFNSLINVVQTSIDLPEGRPGNHTLDAGISHPGEIHMTNIFRMILLALNGASYIFCSITNTNSPGLSSAYPEYFRSYRHKEEKNKQRRSPHPRVSRWHEPCKPCIDPAARAGRSQQPTGSS